MSGEQGRPPYPPFTAETAKIKVKAAQDAWNTKYALKRGPFYIQVLAYRIASGFLTDKLGSSSREPHKIKLAYTEDSIWRNRDQFFTGRDAIVEFLTKKWEKENGYRLRKELFAFNGNKIAVQFWYEWHDEAGQWYRTYGLEDWTFADNGLMGKRQMSGNDVKISDEERWYKDGVDVNTVDISEKHW